MELDYRQAAQPTPGLWSTVNLLNGLSSAKPTGPTGSSERIH